LRFLSNAELAGERHRRSNGRWFAPLGKITVEELFEKNDIRQKFGHKLPPERFRQCRFPDRDQIASENALHPVDAMFIQCRLEPEPYRLERRVDLDGPGETGDHAAPRTRETIFAEKFRPSIVLNTEEVGNALVFGPRLLFQIVEDQNEPLRFGNEFEQSFYLGANSANIPIL